MWTSAHLRRSFRILIVSSLALHLPGTAVASGPKSEKCNFTISVTGGDLPPGIIAGQLPDGQIRVNGSEPTAHFTLAAGRITDMSDRGCIVTDPPTTQLQCDEGKAPFDGFAVSPDKASLTYHGSAAFWACPATDTTYNLYVSPNFGQAKCFPVCLTAVGCGGGETCSASTQTAWMTTWLTVTAAPATVTVTGTCSTSSGHAPTTTGNWTSPVKTRPAACKKCTGTGKKSGSTTSTKVW